MLVPTTPDYQLDLDAIAHAITPRTRAVVTVSPNNPTGAVYPEPTLRAVNALCRDRGIFHIHDEAYEYFTYGGARAFLAGIDRRRRRAHDLAVLAVQGLRHGQLARRLHGDARRALGRVNKIQDTILDLPAGDLAAAALAALSVGAGYARAQLAHSTACAT